MKSQATWFASYAENHQNATNQKIHMICVPLIYFSIIGLLTAIPHAFIQRNLGINQPVFGNYAPFIAVILMLFYLSLSIRTFIIMGVFTLLSLYISYYISLVLPLIPAMGTIFVLAWLGQVYGHK